jgi:hypothetical protein
MPKAVNGSPSAFVDGDSAHVIVRSRTDGNRLRHRIDSRVATKRGDRRDTSDEVDPLQVPRIEKHTMVRRHMLPDGACDGIARRELGTWHVRHEAIAIFANEGCAFSAHGLTEQFQAGTIRCRVPSG